MIRAQLDAVTKPGCIEGWAYDDDAPCRGLAVSAHTGYGEVASGLANLYRQDLAEAGCGSGWCAFCLRIVPELSVPPAEPIILHDMATQKVIARSAGPFIEKAYETAPDTLESIIRSDPTIVTSIDQLRGCAAIFTTFIETAGIEEYVSRAFLYVLGRPADPGGLAEYAKHLRTRSMTPYEILRVLWESEEFRSAPPLLIAPPEPGFAFRLP